MNESLYETTRPCDSFNVPCSSMQSSSNEYGAAHHVSFDTTNIPKLLVCYNTQTYSWYFLKASESKKGPIQARNSL